MSEGPKNGKGNTRLMPSSSQYSPRITESLLKKDLSVISEEARFNYKCYFFASLGSLMLGTKMLLITIIGMNEYWIFFIEHVAIWMTCIVVVLSQKILKSCQFSSSDSSNIVTVDNGFQIIKDYRQLICGFLAGSLNATGNASIIFAMKHAYASGASPSTISSILMFNVILILIAGVTIFNERHKLMKIVGGIMVFVSLIVVATQRSFESSIKYTETQNDDYNLALFFVGGTTVCWGCVAIVCKYATYFYGANPVEFGTVAMTLSGLYGSCSIIFLVYSSEPFELHGGYTMPFSIFLCVVCGSFTALACFCLFKAISIGSAEISQLIVNTKILVQMIEEFIILHIFPSTVAFIGMMGVFVGVAIMIFTKEKRNLRHVSHDHDVYIQLEDQDEQKRHNSA